jgi:hypothetical protein
MKKLSKPEIKRIFRDLAKKSPVTWSLISKKCYILPQYRQSDYYEQDDLTSCPWIFLPPDTADTFRVTP